MSLANYFNRHLVTQRIFRSDSDSSRLDNGRNDALAQRNGFAIRSLYKMAHHIEHLCTSVDHNLLFFRDDEGRPVLAVNVSELVFFGQMSYSKNFAALVHQIGFIQAQSHNCSTNVLW